MTDLEKAIDLIQNGLVKGYNGAIKLSSNKVLAFKCGMAIEADENFIPSENNHNNKVSINADAIKLLIKNYDTNPTGEISIDDKTMTVYHGITIDIK